MSDVLFNIIVVTIALVAFFGAWLIIAAECMSDDYVIKGNKGFKKSWLRKVIDGLKAIIEL